MYDVQVLLGKKLEDFRIVVVESIILFGLYSKYKLKNN